MACRATDPKPGSLWIVGRLPYRIVLDPTCPDGECVYLYRGSMFIVLDQIFPESVRILTSQGQVGFIDRGWWIPGKNAHHYLVHVNGNE